MLHNMIMTGFAGKAGRAWCGCARLPGRLVLSAGLVSVCDHDNHRLALAAEAAAPVAARRSHLLEPGWEHIARQAKLLCAADPIGGSRARLSNRERRRDLWPRAPGWLAGRPVLKVDQSTDVDHLYGAAPIWAPLRHRQVRKVKFVS